MSPSSSHRQQAPEAALAAALRRPDAARARLLIAYSGGPDSTVLLGLAAAQVPSRRLRAVHVHHGWHAEADAWAEQCREVARRLGVACRTLRVDSRPRHGEGPEAAARTARYEALKGEMASGDVLLTAHHLEDQAETVLLGLLRGGGLRALAAMPVARALGPGIHLRPLLDVPGERLRAALERLDLPWIEDPANDDPRFDRVFLRERVLPALRERWPGVESGLARTALLAGEGVELEDSAAARDYVDCRGRLEGTLDCTALTALPAARQRALMRWWLRREGLPVPAARRLESARRQLADAGAGRNPRVDWPGGEIRRWSGLVWALRPRPPIEPGRAFVWADPRAPLELPDRRLRPEMLARLGIASGEGEEIVLRYRAGGERLRPRDEGRERALTELLREAGLPPWERERALLVERDGCPAGVLAAGTAIVADSGADGA